MQRRRGSVVGLPSSSAGTFEGGGRKTNAKERMKARALDAEADAMEARIREAMEALPGSPVKAGSELEETVTQRSQPANSAADFGSICGQSTAELENEPESGILERGPGGNGIYRVTRDTLLSASVELETPTLGKLLKRDEIIVLEWCLLRSPPTMRVRSIEGWCSERGKDHVLNLTHVIGQRIGQRIGQWIG